MDGADGSDPHPDYGGLRLHHRGVSGHPGELRRDGGLHLRLSPLLPAGPDCHPGLPAHRLSGVLLDGPGGGGLPAGGHGPDYAAHVDELPPADLLLDVHSGEQRPFKPAVPGRRTAGPAGGGVHPHDRHLRGGGAGHGV